MQIYAVRMFNFLRFGEKDNSVVFDLSETQKNDLATGKATMDSIYDEFKADPVGSIEKIKARGIEPLLGIVGQIDGNPKSSNGAGKSTILEAFCYAHYGKIVRLSANTDSSGDAGNLIATHINGEIAPNIEEAWVEEYFEANGKVYRIKRGRAFSKTRKTSSPILEFESLMEGEINSESGHRTTDTKKSIDEVNDMSYDLFINSQMFGQNDAGKFLCGTDKTKKEMMISLLNMDSVVTSCIKVAREKRSKQEKVLTSINETMRVLENNLLSLSRKHLYNTPAVFSEAVAADLMLFLNQKIENNTFEIQTANVAIGELDVSLTKLRSSDTLSKIASIKETGLKVKAEKADKLRQKEEQISQWKNLLDETERDIQKNKLLSSQLMVKKKEAEDSIKSSQSFVDGFDKKKHEDNIALAKRAKETKPKYDAIKQKLTDEVVMNATSSSEIRTKISMSQNTIVKLKNQLDKIGNSGTIECLECKSLQTASHFEGKIAEEEKRISEFNVKLEEVVKKDAETKANLETANTRLNRLLELMSQESISIKELNVYESKVQAVSSWKEKQSEINEAITENSLKEGELGLKKAKYESKMSDIENAFSGDINTLDSKLNSLRNEMAEAQKGADAVNQEIARIIAGKKALESTIAKYNEENGSIKKEIEHFKAMGMQLKERLAEHVVETKTLSRLERAEEVFGLDGIQTRIVKRYLPLLNVYIKEFLDILSGGKMTVKLFVNGKSEVDLSISGGSGPIYKMLSGGEKMQIRLATDIGLARLKFVRSAKQPEIICLDEIFGPLDEVNTDSVFKMLLALQSKFKRVLIITHNSDIKAMINTNILVEKNGGPDAVSKIKLIG